jgi:hypothetical protein
VTDVMSPYAIKKARNLSEDSAEVVFGTWGMGMGSVALAAFRCRRHRMGMGSYTPQSGKGGTRCVCILRSPDQGIRQGTARGSGQTVVVVAGGCQETMVHSTGGLQEHRSSRNPVADQEVAGHCRGGGRRDEILKLALEALAEAPDALLDGKIACEGDC